MQNVLFLDALVRNDEQHLERGARGFGQQREDGEIGERGALVLAWRRVWENFTVTVIGVGDVMLM